MSAPGRDVPRPSRALRLTFVYEGDRVRLVDRRPLEVIVPSSDEAPVGQEARGFWIELRSDEERVLHRRIMQDAWAQDAEVFSPDPGQSVARVPLEQPSGTFSVLLPEAEEADHVVLLGAPMPGAPTLTARGAETPVELARFSLRPESGGS